MAARTAYERRVAALLADEDYGPKLARLNRYQTGEVLELVRQNRGAEARREILRYDEQRRQESTRKRIENRNQRIQTYILDTLRAVPVYANPQTVAFGVSLMTRTEGDRTLDMDADEIRDHAGNDGFIKLYLDESLLHNVWWYH